MDLCREILRQVEASPDTASVPVKVEGRSAEELSYHVKLLAEAGLIEAASAEEEFVEEKPSGGIRKKIQPVYSPVSLTWQGHEFLDASRDDTVWKKAKERLAGTAGALTFDLVVAACKAEIARRTGLEL